ncbi:protein FAR-RED-ELONGATED HYPOCOTYL 1-LIKE-like isoform X2 [Magnolia sinica]|uniref:protein FAR-RED-ELONGATED HYPOCOTYL 1-LIKE-like isoform X2 n=1 Tax=Magnolia sinica TaxID=86752 RepID=UPI002659CFCA|nr:protein FAR-RED-ELONGATED HYPOCOTYL 1-LIKE-like isoform X2 [Magnolia sinica]
MGQDKENPYEISSPDSNKKRKLQEGQLGLPSPKHKFRDRSCGSHDNSPITGQMKDNLHACTNEGKTDSEDYGGLEQCESVRDSNNYTGSSDTAMSIDNTEATEKYERRPTKSHPHDWPSTSSGSCSINSDGNSLYDPTSGTMDKANTRGLMHGGEDLDHTNSKAVTLEDHLAGFGTNYADFICEENENDRNEQPLDAAADEMMIYSNGVAQNLYALSSGRWSINQDARLGARKPTIDQEFEQYFSMLML